MALCWPDGAVVWDPDTGLAACSPNAINPGEGRKSFPSGDQLFYLSFAWPLHLGLTVSVAWCCFVRTVHVAWAVLMACCLAPSNDHSRLTMQ